MTLSAADVHAQNASLAIPAISRAAPLLPIGKMLFDAALAHADQPSGGLQPPVTWPAPSCGFAGGLCGALKRDGTLAVAPDYDWVDEFHEGRALVRAAGLYGYVDDQGREIAKPQYAIAGSFARGFAQVDVDGRSGLIDRDGHFVVEPKFGFVVPFTDDVFWVSEGRTVSDGPPGTEKFNFDRVVLVVNGYSDRHVNPSGKWGLIDRSGSWVRSPEFAAVGFFDTTNGATMLAKADSGWGAIRPDGTWQIEPRFQQLGKLVDGLASAKIDDHWGFVDHSGQIKIQPTFDLVFGFGDSVNFAAARVDKRWGLIDRAGAWIVAPQYDEIFPGGILIPKSWWKIKSGGKYGLLDETGRLVIQPLFDQAPRRCDDGFIIGDIEKAPHLFSGDGKPVAPPEGQLWWPASCDLPHIVKIGDRFAYADGALSPITPPKFTSTGYFVGDRLAVASIDGKFGLAKPDGEWALPPTLQAVSPAPANGVALAKQNDQFGLIDVTTGDWVTPQRFDGICSLGTGLSMVVKDGKRGILDNAGHWLIEPNFSRLGIRLTDGLVPAQVGTGWGMTDMAGTLVIDARFDAPTFFDQGINWAKTGETWCPIDRRGKSIAHLACQASDPYKRDFGRVFDCRI